MKSIQSTNKYYAKARFINAAMLGTDWKASENY
jgi:hypothetical protein